jgi:AhpD family alkylhydroperoxidase
MYAPVNPDTATGLARELLAATRKQLGRVPNLYAAMANSPSALGAYLAFRGALQSGALPAEMAERVALLVAQLNACDYCVAAHTFRGRKIGLADADLAETRHGRSGEPRIDAALAFVTALIEGRGMVAPARAEALLAHGWSEAEIGEIVAHVALNVFSNYFKQVAGPELDFPPAPELLR